MSPETLEEVFAQYMPTTLIPLIRYEGKDNSGNIVERRYVSNWESITSNGKVFQKAAFKMALGTDSADSMPTVTLSYDGGDMQTVNELRVYNEAPKIYFSVVVAERPNVVEVEEIEFEVKEWNLKDSALNITLQVEPVLNEPIVGDLVTPQLFPLLWENVTVKGQ